MVGFVELAASLVLGGLVHQNHSIPFTVAVFKLKYFIDIFLEVLNCQLSHQVPIIRTGFPLKVNSAFL